MSAFLSSAVFSLKAVLFSRLVSKPGCVGGAVIVTVIVMTMMIMITIIIMVFAALGVRKL